MDEYSCLPLADVFKNKRLCEVHRESVAHSKSACSENVWLNTIERGQHMNGWLFRARLCTPTVGDFPRSPNTVQTLLSRQSPSMRLEIEVPRSHTGVKYPLVHVRVCWNMKRQLAFPGESDPNFPWEKAQWDNKLLNVILFVYLLGLLLNFWIV